MAWFRKPKQKLQAADRREVPADVFEKCPQCGEILYKARLAQNLNVCPSCGYHLRIGAEDYIRILLDEGEFVLSVSRPRSARLGRETRCGRSRGRWTGFPSA